VAFPNLEADAEQGGDAVAIASSSPLPWVRNHLSRVGAFEMFDVVATGDEVPTHKPDPGVYQLALERLGLSGGSAIAVEDTAHGVTAARSVGMATVAIPNPFVDVTELCSADLLLASATDVRPAEVLDRLANGAQDAARAR
jgi:beta-phosphoglucomutase-like phosphatase (HAD superfamily)